MPKLYSPFSSTTFLSGRQVMPQGHKKFVRNHPYQARLKWKGTEPEFILKHKVMELTKTAYRMTVIFVNLWSIKPNEVIEIDDNMFIVSEIHYAQPEHRTKVVFSKIKLADDSPEGREEFLANLESNLEDMQGKFSGPAGPEVVLRKPMIRPDGPWKVSK